MGIYAEKAGRRQRVNIKFRESYVQCKRGEVPASRQWRTGRKFQDRVNHYKNGGGHVLSIQVR